MISGAFDSSSVFDPSDEQEGKDREDGRLTSQSVSG